MRITIRYESSWQNSFLDGSNNKPLPKRGRGFIGSMAKLNDRGSKGENFIKREITHDTVMGVLNRLIGDQRKLYQAKSCPAYFFREIEHQIDFSNDQSKLINNMEVMYIRNMTGSTDQNSFTGAVRGADPIFSSDYSALLWGVLLLDFNQVCKFILDVDFFVGCKEKFDPITVLDQLEQLNKLKMVAIVDQVHDALIVMKDKFPEVIYKIIDGKIRPIEIYCSALYLQLSRLSKQFDLSSVLTKKGGISGISKRGFTPKDFMGRFTTGDKKLVWGNPYILKQKLKGEGEVVSMLTKASGLLDIVLNIPDEKASMLKEMIEAAGVSSFYLGKKGLAYVDKIRI